MTDLRRIPRLTLPPLLLLIPSIAVALLMATPVVYLVIRASSAGVDAWPLVFRERTAILAWNTIRLAATVSLTASLIAVPLAWLTVRSDLPWRRFWNAVIPLPLVIPSYAGAVAIIGAIGPRGLLQEQLERFGVERLPSIYGFTGAWATLSLFTFPYSYLSVRSALQGLDPSLEEASRSLGRGPVRTFIGCTLPQLRPSIGAGVLLVSLYTISDFGVVTMMRYESFVRAIYTQYRAAFDRTLAAALGLLLVLLAIALVAGESRIRRRAGFYRIGTGSARQAPRMHLGGWRWLAAGWCAAIVTLSLGLPLGMVLYWLASGTSAGHDLDNLPSATINSLTISGLTAVFAMTAAIPVAFLAVRYRSRFSSLIERGAYLGFSLPGIVIALAFVFAGSRYLPGLYQTLPLMILALMVRFLPHGVSATKSSLMQISPRVEEASRTLGRSQAVTLGLVTAPLARPGIVAGAILVFLGTMKELPIILLLAPSGFDTLATEIWSSTSSGRYGGAAAPALLLIALSSIPTLLLDRRRMSGAPAS
jgi:iron(III) transport system permease protein